MNKIITIGREFGSGGREFGRRLAEELGYEYYDKEIVAEIAKHTELSEKYVQQVIECDPHTLFPITVGHTFAYMQNYGIERQQAIYREQCAVIRAMAEKSNCVIVGRCADYILKDYKPFKIFVYSETECKIRRCRERGEAKENFSDKKLMRYIKNVDKSRARYYSFYTGQDWGKKTNYDICVNTSTTDMKVIVPLIAKMFK